MIRLTNIDTGKSYIASTRSDCIGVDVHIWDMMIHSGIGPVTMGHTIGEWT
jgi:hypothetical protein